MRVFRISSFAAVTTVTAVAAGAAAGLAGVILCTTLWVLFRYAHPVVYGDTWYMLDLLRAWRDGIWPDVLRELWVPWNQHRIVFPKLLYLADFQLVSGTGLLLRVLNLVCQGVVVVLGARAVLRANLPASERYVLAATGVATGFWLVQSGNLIWGFQIAWFLAHACLAGAIWLTAGIGNGSGVAVWRKLGVAAVCAAVATYSLASGMLVWGVLALVFLKAGVRPAVLVIWIACGVAAVGTYFFGLASSGVLHSDGLDTVRILRYFVVLAGGPLSRFSLMWGGAAGIAGGLLMAALSARFLFGRRPDFWERFAFSFAAYSALTLAAMAVGRSHFDLANHATSSRYYSVVLLFWTFALSLAWTYVRPVLAGVIRQVSWGAAGARTAGVVAVIGVLVVVSVGQVLSVSERRERFVSSDHAALALVTGVHDLPVLGRVNHEVEEVLRGEPYVRAERVGHHAPAWAQSMGQLVSALGRIDSAAVPWDGVVLERVGRGHAAREGVFLQGSVRPDVKGRVPEVVVAVRAGHVVGLARTRARGCHGCFSGYAQGRGDTLAFFGWSPARESVLRPVVF